MWSVVSVPPGVIWNTVPQPVSPQPLLAPRHRLQAQVVHTAAILSRRSTATFGSAGYVVQRGRTEFRLWMRSPRGGRAVDRGAPICLRGAGAHARPRWWWCRNAWDAPLIAV